MSWMSRFGAGWLIAMSAILSFVGISAYTTSRWACGEGGSAVGCDLANIGVVALFVMAAVHLVAGVAAHRGGTARLAAGAAVATAGAVASLLLAATEPWFVAAAFFAPYATAAVALWHEALAGRHGGRPHWSARRRFSMPSGQDPAGDVMPPHP